MNIKKSMAFIFIALLCVSISACSWIPLYNYTLKDRPKYVNNHTNQNKTTYDGSIKVVSYNIKHSKKMDKAIKLIKEHEKLADADIIFLQEMTPDGIIQIAHALNYNFVYYPAILHPQLKKDFGNAIVSKWPLSDDYKIILPPITHKSRQRIAIGATVKINNKTINVFSLHMGIFIRPDERKNMVDLIINSVDETCQYSIIGGDFNSFTKKDRKNITESFARLDYQHATPDIGWTYKQWYFFNRKAPLDHIFAKNMHVVQSGKIEDRSPDRINSG
ncbi:MAG: endonuclease/exonuclease/phosphatase family protein [Candidatus Omnitrophica bacterium]|nr:endonuclease/exonuclease/phosphatase family protein [Candidatus Omnitrophota bacterium]